MNTRIIGLTGGVGMGKSTVAKLLREKGVPVVDSDDLAREVVAAGEPALSEIAESFGAEFLDAGKLDRAKMAAHIFGNDVERKKLEAVIHPRVRERWLAQMEVAEKIERADQVVWTEGDVSLLREQLQSIFRE